jgi:hypothetical protein
MVGKLLAGTIEEDSRQGLLQVFEIGLFKYLYAIPG